MKKFNANTEVERMKKQWDNCTGIQSKKDLKTFAVEYYGNWLKQIQEKYEFWKTYEPPKKKVIVKIKRKNLKENIS